MQLTLHADLRSQNQLLLSELANKPIGEGKAVKMCEIRNILLTVKDLEDACKLFLIQTDRGGLVNVQGVLFFLDLSPSPAQSEPSVCCTDDVLLSMLRCVCTSNRLTVVLKSGNKL